jgi:hypothetical protein
MTIHGAVVRFVVRFSQQVPTSWGRNPAPMPDFMGLTVRLPYFVPPESEWGSGGRGFKSRRPDFGRFAAEIETRDTESRK